MGSGGGGLFAVLCREVWGVVWIVRDLNVFVGLSRGFGGNPEPEGVPWSPWAVCVGAYITFGRFFAGEGPGFGFFGFRSWPATAALRNTATADLGRWFVWNFGPVGPGWSWILIDRFPAVIFLVLSGVTRLPVGPGSWPGIIFGVRRNALLRPTQFIIEPWILVIQNIFPFSWVEFFVTEVPALGSTEIWFVFAPKNHHIIFWARYFWGKLEFLWNVVRIFW